MNIRHILVLLLISLAPITVSAQMIDNTLSWKSINNDRYIRFNYENDFFAATDKYYTQGLHFELVSPWVKDFPLSKLLIHPSFGYIRYGIGLEHEGYTPSDFSTPDILYGDRPFAACFFLKTFSIAVDTIKKQRFSTTLNAGIIGQGAGGEWMQVGIHKALNNIIPHGWQNQIDNDVILNYQVDYERQLLSYRHLFSLDADAIGRIGTLSDKAGAGITMIMGYFDSPFGNTKIKGSNLRVYAYEHLEVNFIGYDATLQGGLFDKSSPYTILAKDITRLTFQNRFGFVVTYRRLYLEYFQSMLSSEFRTGNYHVWGGIQVAVGF